jgi:exosortase D (VPLPA-CTERM-specific)
LNSDLELIASIRPVSWLKTVIYGLLIFFVYRSTLDYLFVKWQSEDFTYCYMIPLIVIYMIWEKREILSRFSSVSSWKGLIPLIIGFLLYWLGELTGEFTMLFFSLWMVMVALCWLHLGWKKLKIISFPVAFSLAMFVPPNALYAPLTLKLKLISSQVGVVIMQLYGLSAYREGNVIDLGFTKLQVVDACSGLRYVIPLFLMGLLLAYYYKAALWKRIFLVASTVPLSIITNSLRIASVGILYQFWGPVVAEGFFHDFSGWFIFMAGLCFLLLEMWLLKKVFKGDVRCETGDVKARDTRDVRCETVEDKDNVLRLTSNFLPSFLRPPQFIVAVIVLLLIVSLSHMVNFREKTPLVKPFAGFPLQVGKWSGARTEMEQKFLDVLKLSDYTIIDYRNLQGKEVNFYVAYNQSQSKGEATHSPATCLPSSGWVFQESGMVAVPVAAENGAKIQVSRAYMEKNGVKQVTYYWFPQRGRVLNNIYQIKLYNFWDALTRHRTDGALVRVITPVYENESPGEAEQRLQGFTRQIVPVLGTYLPQ